MEEKTRAVIRMRTESGLLRLALAGLLLLALGEVAFGETDGTPVGKWVKYQDKGSRIAYYAKKEWPWSPWIRMMTQATPGDQFLTVVLFVIGEEGETKHASCKEYEFLGVLSGSLVLRVTSLSATISPSNVFFPSLEKGLKAPKGSRSYVEAATNACTLADPGGRANSSKEPRTLYLPLGTKTGSTTFTPSSLWNTAFLLLRFGSDGLLYTSFYSD